jgi:hypothetical protein
VLLALIIGFTRLLPGDRKQMTEGTAKRVFRVELLELPQSNLDD